ncbi:MAG: hypothetical protein F6K39_44060 [Okeania sp. SIO3B3]|nr:hypothetical protein [Okeania sp. SIO3B3]
MSVRYALLTHPTGLKYFGGLRFAYPKYCLDLNISVGYALPIQNIVGALRFANAPYWT